MASKAKKGTQRKLTAILSADVVGYSRLMGDDEEATIESVTASICLPLSDNSVS